MYAEGLTYDAGSHKLQQGGTDIGTLTVGNVIIHGIKGSNGEPYGITIGHSIDQYVMISNHDIFASGSVTSAIFADVSGARMQNGNVAAKKDLYVGYDSYNPDKGTYDNPKFAVKGDDGSFKAAGDKFAVDGNGAITAESLTLADNYNVKDKIEANKKSTEDNKAALGNLETKTQGITRVGGNSTTVEGVNFKDGAVSGVKSINGDIEFDKDGTKVWVNGAVVAAGVAANNITANNFVTVGNENDGYVHMTNAGIAVNGRLYSSLDPNATDLKSVSVAEMANTRDNTNKISYNDTEGTKIDSNVIINKGKKNQVAITEDGIVVGLNSSVVNDDGVFAGGHDYNNAKAAFNANDGSIKGANGKFTVDDKGNVVSKGSVTANQAGFNDLAVTNGLTVGDNDPNGKFVNMQNGSVVATGSVTAMGDLAAVGNLYVSGQSTFTNGVKTDKIEEATADAGVTVDGVVLKDGGISAADGKFTVDGDGAVSAAGGKFGVDKDGNATVGGTLDVTGNTTIGGTLGVTGDATVGGTLNVAGDTTLKGNLGVTGNATVGGTLGVTGDATFSGNIKGQSLNIGTIGNEFTVDTDGAVIAAGGKVSIDKDGNAQFGDTGANITKIQGKKITTGYIQTDNNIESSIGGVKMQNGKITASNMEITGAISLNDLTVNNKLTVGTFGVTKAGVVTGVTSINDVAVSKQGTGLTIGSATVGDTNPFSSQGYTVDATGNVSAKDITAGKYNGNEITADKKFNGVKLDGGNVKATKVTADTITDSNGFTATNCNVAAKNITADNATIAGVSFAAGGNVSGISELTATTIKDGAGTIITGGKVESKTAKIGAINIDNETIEGSFANGLSIEGVKIKDGVMSAVVSIDANKATIGGVNTLDNTGLTVKTGSKVQVGTNTVIEDGSVKVSQKTSLTDQSLQLNDTNKWTQTGGLVADKATVNGIALGTDSKGKATFSDAAGKTTTIDGDKITTGTITADKLLIDKISLGKDGSDNISIDKDGDVTTKGDVTIKGADDDTTVIDGAKATFGKDAANQTTIDKGKIKAKAEDNSHQQAGLTFNENGLTVSGQNAEGKTSSFSFNAKTGANTFTGQDGTFTTINGSSVRSYNSATGAGHLNGATLNLWKDNDNSTYMTAGGATFNGAAGEKGGKTTTINGGTITTDTLNVERINLGGELYDKNGTAIGGNLSMDKDGNFSAAGGNFTVKGGTGADKGAFTNKVGNTTLKTDNAGASMSYDNTAATGGVKSNVSVGNNNANVSAGAGSIDVTNESITSKVTDNATSTITKDSIVDKVGNNSVTTDAKGTTFANGGTKTTNINGGTITTGKLITDELVITGKGDAAGDGSGSLAFGGNGTIKSDVKEAGSAKNTQFTTNIDGVNTKVTDGTTTTENKVSAAGNSNTVKQDDTHKSEFNQGLTSIGGVVTNGTVKIAQTLDGENGNITNEVIDKDGKSSKLVQNGTGLEYTDSAKPDNATRINSSDVSIGSATNEKDRINLSDLGQIDDLDKELSNRDEYKKNQTAVGGINAEAAIRRGEVERLDNRISEEVIRLDGRINDVNDRVNKVGAMAAAIASLKSIGYDPQAPSEFSIGLGQYKGETGVAMGFFHYPNKNFMINVSLSTAGGETMGGIGATWRFGHKSPQKLLEEQREAQAKKELAAAEKYQAAAKLAKEAQERAEYAAKLARQAQVSADNAKAAADATQAKHFG